MSSELDDLIRERMQRSAPAFAPDWSFVERRSRSIRRGRRLRRGAFVGLVVALLSLLVTPAGARLGEVLGLVGGDNKPSTLRSGLGTVERPPASVVQQLDWLDVGRPADVPPLRPRAAESRTLLRAPSQQGELVIRVTPADSGRACMSLSLTRPGKAEEPQTIGCFPDQPITGIEPPGALFSGEAAHSVVYGRVASAATRVEIVFDNGARQRARLQNGWYVALVDGARILIQGADAVAAVVAYDGAGVEVARAASPRQRVFVLTADRPPVADIRRERRVALVRGAPDGTVGELFLSPTRGNAAASCGRVRVGEIHAGWICEDLPPYSPELWLSLSPVGEGAAHTLFVHGAARDGLRVELRFEHGARESVPLHDRFFLTAVSPERMQPGRRLLAVVAMTAAGDIVRTIPIATRDTPLYDSSLTPAAPTATSIAEPPSAPTEVVALETAAGGVVEWKVWQDVPPGRATEITAYRGRPVGLAIVGPELPGSATPIIGLEYVPIRSDDGHDDLSLLVGVVRQPATALRIRYGNGSTEPVPLTGTRFLFEITDARRARRPLRLEAVDAIGAVISRERIAADAV